MPATFTGPIIMNTAVSTEVIYGLPVVGPVVPYLIGEISTEEASHRYGYRVLAVEKSARGEVVRLSVELVLLVGGEGVVGVVVQITKALEQVLCGNVPQLLRLDGQSVSPFLQNFFTNRYAHSLRDRYELG